MKPGNLITVKVCTRTLICVFLLVFTQIVSAATLYKWVDENGVVRYSDRLPPKQVKKKHQMLNSQGVVVKNTEAAKSDEEILAEQEARKELEKEKVLKDEQDKKDQVLLMTFSSEKELSRVRDNRIAVVDSVIQLIQKSIATTQKKLSQFEKSAETVYISKNLEVPGGLAQNIEHFSRKVKNREAQLKLKQAEKDRISAQYELDIERFRLLKEQDASN